MTLNKKQHPSVSVKAAPGKGRAVFSKKKFSVGDLVIPSHPASGPTERNWATIQMDIDIHVIPDEPFLFANHSCEPNCGIKPNIQGAYDLIAIRDIEIGEEITWDYCTSEWEMVGFSRCKCGSPSCRKTLSGAKNLPKEFFQKHSGFLAPYYEKIRPSE